MKKVLIIEDEILIQTSLKKMLEMKGCEVDAVASGKQGLELILSNDYNLIITDLMLQDITGFDIIEDSKKKYNPEQIKDLFIIMTAYSSEQVISKAKSYGTVVLSKPFDDIMETLNFFMSRISE